MLYSDILALKISWFPILWNPAICLHNDTNEAIENYAPHYAQLILTSEMKLEFDYVTWCWWSHQYHYFYNQAEKAKCLLLTMVSFWRNNFSEKVIIPAIVINSKKKGSYAQYFLRLEMKLEVVSSMLGGLINWPSTGLFDLLLWLI